MKRVSRAFFAGILGAVSLTPAFSAGLGTKEEQFVRQLVAVKEKFKDGGVWPGFDPFSRPLLVHFAGRGNVFVGHNPPPGYSKAGSFALPVYGGGGAAEESVSTGFLSNYKVGGVDAFFCRVPADAETGDAVTLAVHERFHEYQNANFTKTASAGKRKEESAETFEQAYAERVFLGKALLAGRGFTEDIRKFIALRDRRRSAAAPGDGEAEDNDERIEGTATYVGYRTHGGAPPCSVCEADLRVAGRLLKPLEEYIAAGGAGRNYESGAAQALLLERLRIPWKARVEKGETLFSLLREYFPLENKTELLAQADAYIGEAVAVVKKASLASIGQDETRESEYRSYSGHTLLVNGLALSGLSMLGGKTINIKDGVLYSDVQFYEKYIKGVKLSASNTSVADENGLVKVLLGENPEVHLELDGKKAKELPAGPVKFKTLILEAQKVKLEVKRPGTFRYDNKRIRVDARLLPPGALADPMP